MANPPVTIPAPGGPLAVPYASRATITNEGPYECRIDGAVLPVGVTMPVAAGLSSVDVRSRHDSSLVVNQTPLPSMPSNGGGAVGYSVTLLPGQSVVLRAKSAHSSAQLVADSATDSATVTNTTKGTPPVTLTKPQGPQPLAASVGDLVTFAAPRANAGPVTVGGN